VNPSREQKSTPVRLTLGGKPSGLRNPSRALRGLGSIALFLEALVLLLAIQPIRILDGAITAAQLAVLLGSACAAILLTGLLRSGWGWWLGAALQVVLIAGGLLLHWMIGAVGVLFGLVWLYVLYVRRKVLM
jgi:uncharacterized protein DUF4233